MSMFVSSELWVYNGEYNLFSLVPKSLKSMTNEDSSSSLSKAKRRKIFQRKSRTNRRKVTLVVPSFMAPCLE